MVVKIRADRLEVGQRFVFAEEFGGQGEVVTVDAHPEVEFDIAFVSTEELGVLMFLSNQMIEVRGEEEP